jgi:drug/metabolite transporter (DMT)-like permease
MAVSTLGLSMVFSAMFLWTISSIGYKKVLGSEGVETRDPITSLAIRIAIVAVLLMILCALIGDLQGLFNLDMHIRTTYWTFALISACLGLCGDICFFFAIRYLDASRIYPLINCQMLFTYPISFYVFNEDLPPLLFPAALMIIIGVYFLGIPDSKDRGWDALPPDIAKRNFRRGIFLGLGTGFFWGMYYLTLAYQNMLWYGPIESNFSRMMIASLIIWTCLLVTRKHLPKRYTLETRDELKAYVYTGIFGFISAGIGDSFYQMGVRENGTAISITLASATPLLNQVFAILFLKEKFRRNFLLGAILIVIANVLVIV